MKTRRPAAATSGLNFSAILCSALSWPITSSRTTRICLEGDLTKTTRCPLCVKKPAAAFRRQLGVGEYLLLSHGEQNSGGRTRSSILADAFEAIIAAIYLDGGMEEARAFILRFVKPMRGRAARPKSV